MRKGHSSRRIRRADVGIPHLPGLAASHIYVDTAPSVSAVMSFNATVPGINQNRTLTVENVDGLANNRAARLWPRRP